jgi:cardiolipin synthase
MSLPNLITIMRILLVPVAVWLVISEHYGAALTVFVVAGISDGIDGYLARRWNARTELGGYLDPLADKALLVSLYVVLGVEHIIPAWLVILVVSRDLLIVSAVLLSWVLDKPVAISPMMTSKVNTTMQILFVIVVLGMLAVGLHSELLRMSGMAAVAALTVASGALYLREWLRHMAAT